MRWSKLQKKLYEIIDPNLNFQIHCVKYRMNSRYGRTDLPRYFITLNNEIIWDYPKDFVHQGAVKNLSGFWKGYPHNTDVSDISTLIFDYINTSKTQIISKQFENDYWGLINILRAADKRIGRRRIDALVRKTHNKAALKIILRRKEKDAIV